VGKVKIDEQLGNGGDSAGVSVGRLADVFGVAEELSRASDAENCLLTRRTF